MIYSVFSQGHISDYHVSDDLCRLDFRGQEGRELREAGEPRKLSALRNSKGRLHANMIPQKLRKV